MHADLEKTLDQIFGHLQKLRRPIAEKRRSGLDPAIIAGKFSSLDLQAPDELIRLYGICDGTETNQGDLLDEIYFFPAYYWMRLAEAEKTYRTLLGHSDWNADWFPIFANGGGDFYAVICSETSSDFGGVVGFLRGETDHLVEFENVATMFLTIEQSYADKAFFVAEGYLEADYSKMLAIAKAAQPHFEEHDAE